MSDYDKGPGFFSDFVWLGWAEEAIFPKGP